MTDESHATRFVVLGCGHSGSTLLTGIFYFSGFRTLGMPTRTFESATLNQLNNILLDQPETRIGKRNIQYFVEQLETQTGGYWCIKDPLLPFTIDHYFPEFPKAPRILFIFRKPENNVEHLVRKMIRWHPDLDTRDAQWIREQEWLRKNRACLEFMKNHPEIPSLWVDYDELLSGSLNPALCEFAGRHLNFSFVSPRKRRASTLEVSDELRVLYREISAAAPSNNAAAVGITSPLSRSSAVTIRDRLNYTAKYTAICTRNRLRRFLGADESYIRPPFPNFQQFLENLEAHRTKAK